MSLFVLQNAHENEVVNDLSLINPDPLMSVAVGFDSSGAPLDGQVIYTAGALPTVGAQVVSVLANSSVIVIVRGEVNTFIIPDGSGDRLDSVFGTTIPDDFDLPSVIEVIYDFTTCGADKDAQVMDASGNFIDYPSHVSLFHELGHAARIILGTLDPTVDDDFGGIVDENTFRQEQGLPLRQGHNNARCALPTESTEAGKPKCFIATAAYGSPSDSSVAFLRAFRDDYLRKTRSGRNFYDRCWEEYYRISPGIVCQMAKRPALRSVVRWSLVSPIVQFVKMSVRMPDASLEDMPEPWRSFLGELRAGLESWTGEIDLPLDFAGLSPADASRELEFVLRYILRRPETRAAYLTRLEEIGQLPLCVGEDAEGIREFLFQAGRTHDEVVRIVGEVPVLPATTRNVLYGRGNDLRSASDMGREWLYTVSVTNDTPVVLDQVVIYYKRVKEERLVFLQEVGVVPGETRLFQLGVCSKMESYALGAFIGDELVAQIPAPGQGTLTPERASQLNADDTDSCADSWRIS